MYCETVLQLNFVPITCSTVDNNDLKTLQSVQMSETKSHQRSQTSVKNGAATWQTQQNRQIK